MSKKQLKDSKDKKRILREEKKEYKKERNAFLKGMKKYEPALAEDILPITAWDKESNYGIMRDGSIVDFMQIICKNLYNASEDELAYDNLKWDKLFMTYPDDLKYVVLNFPINIRTQLNYIKKIAKRTENPNVIKLR